MSRRTFFIVLFIVSSMSSLVGQTSDFIKELEKQRKLIQQQIQETENLLKTTKKDVGGQLNSLATLTGQIEERKRLVMQLNADVEAMDKEISALNNQLLELENDLKVKKDQYALSVRYLQRNRTIQDKLMFIFSAKTLSQTYRRMRYVKEYGMYQQKQGEQIVEKQQEISKKKLDLERTRQTKKALITAREEEMNKLQSQEKQKRTLVGSLQRKQKDLQREINKKRQEANKLNAQIDKLIEEEMAKAQRLAEAERKKTAKEKGEVIEKTPMGKFMMTPADQKLSGSFVNNRGKLPVPISTPYIIVSRYGQYNVEGLRNVKLDNKGIDIQGQPGANALSIFNGKVAAVFEFNGLFNILVRHGNYISVYCNLSEAYVKSGEEVTTKQNLGKIYSDLSDNNRTVLHFQLRKETVKLNPELWIGR
ncbi:MAG: peptidoglycan DD-metalloendopeptidase family protein [Bacteroidales bacterium]|nr:peptidoglycan DD-metalloendopeptidase family protein [Bacteroidales bacterium]